MIAGFHPQHGEFGGVVLPEPVPLNEKVLCAISDALVCCEVQGTLIVLEAQARIVVSKSEGNSSTDVISMSIRRRGNKVLRAYERAVYSTSAVLAARLACRVLFHSSGVPPRRTMYPVRERTASGLWSGSHLCSPAKSASTYKSRFRFFVGQMSIPWSLVRFK